MEYFKSDWSESPDSSAAARESQVYMKCFVPIRNLFKTQTKNTFEQRRPYNCLYGEAFCKEPFPAPQLPYLYYVLKVRTLSVKKSTHF